MKKLFILLGAVVISGTLFAQKPSSDDSKYSLEGMINYSDAGFQWDAPNLRMRYFIKDNIAARVTLGISSTSVTDNVYQVDSGTGIGTIDMGSMSWSLGLGAEYHLSGTDRLSPYFSAGLTFGGMSMTEDWNNSDGVDYMTDMTASVESSSSTFGLGVGAGFDYYVFDNIYIGMEMGLNWNNYTDGGGSTTITTGGTTTDLATGSSGSNSDLSLGGGNMGFRIGWRF
tara:strand:- start:126 stop:806 length:681 start_codon:yes stop_codon:yes gene_type:complete